MEHGHAIDPMSAAGYGSADRSPTAIQAIIAELDATVRGSDAGYAARDVLAAAQRICVAAHRDGLYIEQTIVRLKDTWRSTPGRPKPRSGSSDAVLDQLVSACIREYYTER